VIDLSIELYCFLISIAFVAGFISAIAGGGGMIILPILMAVGLPPLNALATTKIQGFAGVLSSTSSYYKRGFIDINRLKPALIFAAIASLIGVILVHYINTEYLSHAIPVLLILVSLYMLLHKNQPDAEVPAKLSDKSFNRVVGTTAGFYIGLFGPGIGSMLIVAFRSLRGDKLTNAVANAKPIIIAANLVATIAFAVSGEVWWGLGISMAVTQFIAAKLGTRFAIKNGKKIIKPIVLFVCIGAALKLLFFPS